MKCISNQSQNNPFSRASKRYSVATQRLLTTFTKMAGRRGWWQIPSLKEPKSPKDHLMEIEKKAKALGIGNHCSTDVEEQRLAGVVK